MDKKRLNLIINSFHQKIQFITRIMSEIATKSCFCRKPKKQKKISQ